VDHGEIGDQSGRLPIEVFDNLPNAFAKDRSQACQQGKRKVA
jgi:hypothetical protein